MNESRSVVIASMRFCFVMVGKHTGKVRSRMDSGVPELVIRDRLRCKALICNWIEKL